VRDRRLLEYAKAMRREMTEPERLIWNEVRAHRLNGVKFRRQTVIGARYIADFTCRSPIMLVVEIDGETHVGREAYDLVRTGFFEARGYRVLRFCNSDVMSNLDGVLTAIVSALADSPSPQPVAGEQRPALFRPCRGAWPTRHSPEGERGLTSRELTWLSAITQWPSTLRISRVLIPSCGWPPPTSV